MQFSELLKSLAVDRGVCTAQVPEDWAQGRSVFGGLQVVVALRAMRTLVPAQMPLRTLQTNFVAPVPAGAVTARAQILRAGKNAIQVEARLMQGSETLCLVAGIFGQARSSAIALSPRRPEVKSERPIEMPYIAGVMPSFTQHFAARWLRGGLPFTHVQESHAVVEVSLRDEGGAGEDQVVAIADYIPPVALSMLKTPSPGSSMTWMLELLRDRYDDLPLQGWRIDAEMQAARDGYTSQSVTVWAPNGEAAALSRQSMVVFG